MVLSHQSKTTTRQMFFFWGGGGGATFTPPSTFVCVCGGGSYPPPPTALGIMYVPLVGLGVLLVAPTGVFLQDLVLVGVFRVEDDEAQGQDHKHAEYTRQ